MRSITRGCERIHGRAVASRKIRADAEKSFELFAVQDHNDEIGGSLCPFSNGTYLAHASNMTQNERRTIADTETLQTPWDCRWSQPTYPLDGRVTPGQSEPRFLCNRSAATNPARPVNAEACADCPHWELATVTPRDSIVPFAPLLRHADGCASQVTGAVHGLLAAEHSVERLCLVAAGACLGALGLGLSASIVALPIGLAFIVIGVGVVGWGTSRD
jgi:hypothetical protein